MPARRDPKRRELYSRRDEGHREGLIYPVAISVLAVWIMSAFYSFISTEYTPLTVTTPALLMLGGYVFGVGLSRNTNGSGKAKPPEEEKDGTE